MDEVLVRKVCFKCKKEKPLCDFYKHSRMADGHLNKCKECTKADVLINRWKNIDRIRKYDRERGKLPHRIARKTKNLIKERKEFPEKTKARAVVARAKKKGIIKQEPCKICGAIGRIEAHHPDYSKPLDVVWLCSVHHHAVHYGLIGDIIPVE